MTYRDIDPKLAGIYIIKNNVNGKCYIGQSVKLRSRLKDHMRNAKNGKLDLPIYRAINKYGFHNFTVDILESFIPDSNITNEELIKQLDQLEKKYIEEYNAYTEGYNCTKGGDFGVLGLKMTEEQKKKVSENSKKQAVKTYKPIYLYSVKEKSTIYAISITAASNITNIDRSNLIRTARGLYRQTHGYLVAFSLEELEKYKNQFKLEPFHIDNGLFKPKYKVLVETNDASLLLTVKEAAEKLCISTSMVYSILNGHRTLKNGKLTKIFEQSDCKQTA
jgi:group I intron endonuclease|nr:MAG TPA: intron associated endonuclease [Caudoviricetes sp.]